MSLNEKSGTHNVFKILGASNHTEKEREEFDYYATDSIAIDKLIVKFELPKNIYECACGRGDLSKRLKELGCNVYSTDLINRGYGEQTGVDFLEVKSITEGYSILTNPPYKYATEFVLKALELITDKQFVIMVLRLNFLEGKNRRNKIYDKYPPKFVFPFSERLLCAKNANFKDRTDSGSAIAFAIFVWQKGYIGPTILEWI